MSRKALVKIVNDQGECWSPYYELKGKWCVPFTIGDQDWTNVYRVAESCEEDKDADTIIYGYTLRAFHNGQLYILPPQCDGKIYISMLEPAGSKNAKWDSVHALIRLLIEDKKLESKYATWINAGIIVPEIDSDTSSDEGSAEEVSSVGVNGSRYGGGHANGREEDRGNDVETQARAVTRKRKLEKMKDGEDRYRI